MTNYFSLNYELSKWKFQAQNMLRTCCVLKLIFVFMFRTIYIHTMFWAWSFMYWKRNSMNNLSSYYGLVDARISASDKNLPVLFEVLIQVCASFSRKKIRNKHFYFHNMLLNLEKGVHKEIIYDHKQAVRVLRFHELLTTRFFF